MNLKFSSHSLFTFATILTLIQSAVVAPISQFNPIIAAAVAAKPTQPSSNMIPQPAGTKPKQGSNVERAKEAMFRDGNYVKAKQYLEAALKTEPNEPLTYAMNTLYPFSAGD